ncbi:hypothetical protein I204_00006 [Kwoniella mangroviensis CBS 8886]|nr:hypothetical protein I204_00006 [Kwoniella mangroviensis CBS 8886]
MRPSIFQISSLLLPMISARPSTRPMSILTDQYKVFDDIPTEKIALAHDDLLEIGRMAIAINSAYYPKENKLQPHPPNLFINQIRHSKRHQDPSQRPHMEESSIIVSSEDPEFTDDQIIGGDIKWYISHTPSTQTLTLALSSLSSTDELLELLASSPKHNQSLVPLRNLLFPFELLPTFPTDEQPLIYHSYVDSIVSHGDSALSSLLNLIETPPLTVSSSHRDVIKEYVTSLANPVPAAKHAPIKKVEIIGHGLGSIVGLMVSFALKLELESSMGQLSNEIDIKANLLGLPRIGNSHFAKLIDNHITRNQPSLQVNRIISYYDTITHLPGRHLGLKHHAKNELWIGPDSRTVYLCTVESKDCSDGVKLSKTSLLDHLGPYGGVWIDTHCKME